MPSRRPNSGESLWRVPENGEKLGNVQNTPCVTIPYDGVKLIGLHTPGLLGVAIVGQNQPGYTCPNFLPVPIYITPAFVGSPLWGDINVVT